MPSVTSVLAVDGGDLVGRGLGAVELARLEVRPHGLDVVVDGQVDGVDATPGCSASQ